MARASEYPIPVSKTGADTFSALLKFVRRPYGTHKNPPLQSPPHIRPGAAAR